MYSKEKQEYWYEEASSFFVQEDYNYDQIMSGKIDLSSCPHESYENWTHSDLVGEITSLAISLHNAYLAGLEDKPEEPVEEGYTPLDVDLSWCIEDIQQEFGCSDEKANEFLEQYGKAIYQECQIGGTHAIKEFGDEFFAEDEDDDDEDYDDEDYDDEDYDDED